ncbi:adenylate kinase [Candidatus Woesearchaeota archaeon]|nr:adenylate kinase [Candidatus Woesearchaeota archaeon]
MKLLFLGSPGVGKGTYAQVLMEVLEIPHISTGDLLREEAKRDTPLGNEIKKVMEKGELVDDHVMLKLLENRITEDDCKNGFILDGFPRNLVQAGYLKKLVDITHVLNFKADDKIIIQRLSGRITCRKCSAIYNKVGNKPKVEGVCDKCGTELFQRKDDKPESVKKRLEVYKEKTKPLIDYYSDEGLLVEVVINKNISEIKDKLVSQIKAFLEGKIDEIEEIK